MRAKFKLAVKTLLGMHQCDTDQNGVYTYPDAWVQSKKYYGQYGEDAKIFSLFRDQTNGYFVEIGAMEGVRFSNTYLFECLGWKGICIEPHPRYFALLQRNRKNSITLCAAVGKEDKEKTDFYCNYRGALSTLDKGLEKFYRSHYGKWFGGYERIDVPLITLNTLLRTNNAPPRFALLSIDTEGTDRDVLDGFDISYFAPRVVIVEISVRRDPVEVYMRTHGYTLACTNPSNGIWCKDPHDAEIIRNTAVVGMQASPKHPLD